MAGDVNLFWNDHDDPNAAEIMVGGGRMVKGVGTEVERRPLLSRLNGQELHSCGAAAAGHAQRCSSRVGTPDGSQACGSSLAAPRSSSPPLYRDPGRPLPMGCAQVMVAEKQSRRKGIAGEALRLLMAYAASQRVRARAGRAACAAGESGGQTKPV